MNKNNLTKTKIYNKSLLKLLLKNGHVSF